MASKKGSRPSQGGGRGNRGILQEVLDWKVAGESEAVVRQKLQSCSKSRRCELMKAFHAAPRSPGKGPCTKKAKIQGKPSSAAKYFDTEAGCDDPESADADDATDKEDSDSFIDDAEQDGELSSYRRNLLMGDAAGKDAEVADCMLPRAAKCCVLGGCQSHRDFWFIIRDNRLQIAKPEPKKPWDDKADASSASPCMPVAAVCAAASTPPNVSSDSDDMEMVVVKTPEDLERQITTQQHLCLSRALLDQPSLREKRIRGDGTCFFRAVACQTAMGERCHLLVRAMIVEEVTSNFALLEIS